jgi:putative transposase
VSALVASGSARGERKAVCAALGLSRASFYRDIAERSTVAKDAGLALRIEALALEWPSYGYRRILAALRQEGWAVGSKRTLGIMRERGLLCRRRRRLVRTTDSGHGLAVYPNLAQSLCVCRTGQLWIADMTYIRMQDGRFAYMAAVLDAYSRKAVGWAVSERIDTALALSALSMALSKRAAPMFHHSDRGVQYASQAYVEALTSRRVQISMSRTGNPYDNAKMESFMKTLKVEEVYTKAAYETIDEVRAHIGHFLGTLYNQQRLHSALGYRSPEQFEKQQANNNIHFP